MQLLKPPIEDKKGKYGGSYLKQIVDSGKYILDHEKIKAIIFYSMVFYIFYRGGFFMFQPYLKEASIPVEYYGVIFFLFNIVAGITAKNCYKIMERTKGKTLMFLSFLMIISFLTLGITKIWIGVIAMLLQQMARGFYGPATTKYMNKNIPSDKRAIILSFLSLLTNLAGAAAFPLFGVLKDSTNIFNTHLVLAAAMFILTLVTLKYMKTRLGVKKQNEESAVC